MQQTSGEKLERGIHRWDLVALVLNAVIGAGIFGLPARIYALTGTRSLLVFLVCAFLIVLIILCFAEVASRFRDTGGPYLYARTAFGGIVGFEVGWLLWLARITAFAALTNLFLDYLSVFWPGSDEGTLRAILVTVIVAVLTYINVRGVRGSALVIDFFTVAKLIPLVLLVVVGIFFIDPQRYTVETPLQEGAFTEAVLLAVFAFSGFETAVIPAGETKEPTRQMPFALITGTAFIVILYVMIQFVSIGTVPDLAQSERPLADAGATILGPAGRLIITAGALISIGGTLNSISLAAPRMLFALSEQRQFPAFLSLTHPRFRSPYVAIIVSGAAMLAFTLSGSFIQSLTFSTIIRLVTYIATCASLPMLRRRADVSPAGFRVPMGWAVTAGALTLCGWLIYYAPAQELTDTVIVAGIGMLLFGMDRWTRRRGGG